ncbi:secretion/DNA translocation related TadE-like protein [Actinokineospora baliensis]|uniref:Rv3654c family TadE-like protein n=1 Tax=Actinokineospora baliensis TaxID=547056 RepID=UPI00195D3D84|nr:Rv3654c family TadE-like protein [Actinokineospora baliensis]MBM7771405.1 secretion/DNA translocation related TadE-like protein [Actinokineospora baliensis]
MTGDGGFATVFAAWVITGLLSLVLMVMTVAGAVSARHRAESAADLGALAAAGHVLDGQACARARWVVERAGAELVGCAVSGWDATVEVAVRPAALIGSARATARAGPVVDGQAVGSER